MTTRAAAKSSRDVKIAELSKWIKTAEASSAFVKAVETSSKATQSLSQDRSVSAEELRMPITNLERQFA